MAVLSGDRQYNRFFLAFKTRCGSRQVSRTKIIGHRRGCKSWSLAASEHPPHDRGLEFHLAFSLVQTLRPAFPSCGLIPSDGPQSVPMAGSNLPHRGTGSIWKRQHRAGHNSGLTNTRRDCFDRSTGGLEPVLPNAADCSNGGILAHLRCWLDRKVASGLQEFHRIVPKICDQFGCWFCA